MSGSAVRKVDSGYWLPRNFHVRLTALELGGLHSILAMAKRHGEGTAVISKPGPNGEPIETTLIDLLLERVQETIAELVR
jgi:hypothetical protein